MEIFADHTVWHSAGDNAVWIASVVAAIALIYKAEWLLRPFKWVWKRLVSEPIGAWYKEMTGSVVEDKIATSPAFKGQQEFQKRMDDFRILHEDFRGEIRKDVAELKSASKNTDANVRNIHDCIDRRFTETHQQIHEARSDLGLLNRVLMESSGNRERIHHMYDIQDEIVFEMDTLGNFTYLNPAFTNLTGIPTDVALGSGWDYAVHPSDRARVFLDWAQSKKDGTRYEGTFRIRNARGDEPYVDVRVSATTLRDGAGNAVGWVGTAAPTPLALPASIENAPLAIEDKDQHDA